MPTPTPTDIQLYNATKNKLYSTNPTHSAYRSATLVRNYKRNFKLKYGINKKPYITRKIHYNGLKRWFREKWTNQRGQIGYKYISDVYRPNKRISRKTPATFKELSNLKIRKARTIKYRTGRVPRFNYKKNTKR